MTDRSCFGCIILTTYHRSTATTSKRNLHRTSDVRLNFGRTATACSMTRELPAVVEERRFNSPAVTPQALAWHNGALWLGSRDLRRVYGIDVQSGSVFEEREAPGIPWAAVSTGNELRFTIGEGNDDDRYVWSYVPGKGFSDRGRFAYPELTGSYLSYDCE